MVLRKNVLQPLQDGTWNKERLEGFWSSYLIMIPSRWILTDSAHRRALILRQVLVHFATSVLSRLRWPFFSHVTAQFNDVSSRRSSAKNQRLYYLSHNKNTFHLAKSSLESGPYAVFLVRFKHYLGSWNERSRDEKTSWGCVSCVSPIQFIQFVLRSLTAARPITPVSFVQIMLWALNWFSVGHCRANRFRGWRKFECVLCFDDFRLVSMTRPLIRQKTLSMVNTYH